MDRHCGECADTILCVFVWVPRELVMKNGCSFCSLCFRILESVRSDRRFSALQLSCFRVCAPMNYSNLNFFHYFALYSINLHALSSNNGINLKCLQIFFFQTPNRLIYYIAFIIKIKIF